MESLPGEGAQVPIPLTDDPCEPVPSEPQLEESGDSVVESAMDSPLNAEAGITTESILEDLPRLYIFTF